MKIFAERLREIRQERNISVFGLAEKLGVSHASISRWENNQSDITGENLVKVADFFGVTTDYLLGRTD